ncbi:unnamed protein product [Mytilus edulis]|uniref:Thiaminase-2/PQQC domain-containing protein n=1 Tax=Mytilus edulis TaxID=6550 RepID=A0A8S3PWU4_MYTED|nr:unnamed protein product [Mytilus edulis]
MNAFRSNFVQGVKNGILHPTSFGAYMVQDSVYCQRVADALEVAAEREKYDPLKSFLGQLQNEYEGYYMDLFEKWHINDGKAIGLGEACQEYVKTVAEVAEKDDAYYMLVALIPCHCAGAYTDWINSNFVSTSEEYRKLENLVNAALAEKKIKKEKH